MPSHPPDLTHDSSPEPARSIPAEPRTMVPLLPYQREDVESPARFRWNCWARQTGKSFTKSLRRVLRGLVRGRNQIFLSAGQRQCRELMDKARQHCQALKIAADFREFGGFDGLCVRRMEISLPGGVRIIGLPAQPQTARGFTGDVLLDEFAMHAHDRDLWAALFPTLLRGDGELDVASTPRGRGNVFYDLSLNERFSRSLVTLPQAVQQGLRVNVDDVRRAMGDEELFRQEFLCEFLDETTAFLTHAQIAACEDAACIPATRASELAEGRRDLAVGVDVGRKRDLTVMWVLAVEAQASLGSQPAGVAARPCCRTVGLIELGGVPFAAQYSLLSELLRLPRVRRCCIDAGGVGMALAEEAVRAFGEHRVEAVTFTPMLKSQLALGLRRAIEERRIILPEDPRIRSDFHSVERGVTASGALHLSAPRSDQGHADRFWSAALALHAAETGAGQAEVLSSRPSQFFREGAW
ncbi:MAG: hypothetical protein IT449_09310 [Phycisphaerales bacterium]|nr:hypothetical protein [Phycisphaerales bacterium]